MEPRKGAAYANARGLVLIGGAATPSPSPAVAPRLLTDCLPALPSSWKTYLPGWPRCLDEETVKTLNLNIKYSVAKNTTFYLRGGSA